MLESLAWAFPSWGRVAIAPGLLDYAGDALAGLIEGARQQAIAGGVRPLPTVVNRALLGYFPSALLQKCRYATGQSQSLKIPAVGVSYGDANAITLGEVVLFKQERVAECDLKLWAHELTHVMQYQRWGIDDFAHRFVRDAHVLEQEALDNANRFLAWRKGRADG